MPAERITSKFPLNRDHSLGKKYQQNNYPLNVMNKNLAEEKGGLKFEDFSYGTSIKGKKKNKEAKHTGRQCLLWWIQLLRLPL